MHTASNTPTPATLAVQQLRDDDLFGDTSAAITVSPPGAVQGDTPDGLFEFTGTLTGHAELRNKPPRDGLHLVPVVCMHLKSSRPGGPSHCYVERYYTDATRSKAEAFAKDLKRGTPMTVRAQVSELRVSITHPTFIQPLTDDQKA